VEIEAKSAEGAQMLGAITANLGNMFPDDLFGWSHSELAIGIALEGLAKTRDIAALLDDGNNLNPEGYTEIGAYIQAQNH
jgi:hypothetical protein